MRICSFLVGEDWKILKVDAESEHLGEHSFCVWAVERREREIKKVSQCM